MMSILEKKVIFTDETHFDLDGYVNKQNCRIWGTEKTHTLKSRRTQNESLFSAGFGPEAQLGHYSSKIRKESPS